MGRNKRATSTRQPPDENRSSAPLSNRFTPNAILLAVVTGLFVLRPLYPSESVAAEGDGLPVVMLWLLALTYWAILVARGNVQRIRFSWPDIAMGLLVLWHSVAALWAVACESPRPALNMFWEWLGLAIAFFLARQVFRTGSQRRAAGAVMIALAVVVSTYGLYQYFVELPATRAFYEQSSDQMLQQAGLWFPPDSPEREAFEQRLESLEPMATFALTNSLAGFLTPWAIVAMGAVALSAGRLDLRQRAGIAALLIPLGLCLLLTKSRSAYLAGTCGTLGLAALWWIHRNTGAQLRRSLLAVGLAGVLLVLAVAGTISVGGLDAEVLSEAPKSLGYRLQYWQSSWAMIRDMPVLGCGPGNYQHRYTAYKLPEASEEIRDPHNFLIEIWATAGTPAMLAMLGLCVASAVCILRANRAVAKDTGESRTPTGEPPDAGPDSLPIYIGALGGVLLSLPIGVVSAAPPSWFVPLTAIPLGAAALLLLRPWIDRGQDSTWLWALGALAVLIHLLFAGGIAYPAIATGLWLLVAFALGTGACGERPAPQRAAVAVLVAAMALATACYFTGYQPTLAARQQVQRAFAGVGEPRQSILKAVAADPWAVEPRKHLADLIHQQWLEQPSEAASIEFDQAVQDTLARAPRAASLWHHFGQEYRQCFERSRNQTHLANAIRMLESATSLYPNSGQMRADLAEALLLADNQDGYQRQRAEALRLDSLTPHLDKKLPVEQRQRLLRSELAPPLRADTP